MKGSCDLVGIRTPNLLIRSEVLYPVELRNQFPLFGTAKLRVYFKNPKSVLKNITKKINMLNSILVIQEIKKLN
jgi:hypothetical protein